MLNFPQRAGRALLRGFRKKSFECIQLRSVGRLNLIGQAARNPGAHDPDCKPQQKLASHAHRC